jgi:hypothetical protein
MAGRPRKDTTRYSTSQLLNFVRGSYLERTSRPIYALAYLLPFIVIYEIGTLLINTDILNRSQIRVVAFVWLQDILAYAGFGSRFAWIAAPMAVIIILLALQLTSRTKWEVRIADMLPMTAECIVLAVPLIVLSLILNRPGDSARQAQFPYQQRVVMAAAVHGHAALNARAVGVEEPPALAASSAGEAKSPFLVNLVTGIGAGIYEELVFRLILICLFMLILQDIIGLEHGTALIVSILISAALFSAHHHLIFMNGRFKEMAAFSLAPFIFRTVAGVYFACLFAVRGFGITAGTHAFYDILAAVLNVFFFSPQTN